MRRRGPIDGRRRCESYPSPHVAVCSLPSLEGRACAAVFDCKFIETSAAMQHNVWEAFHGIVRQLRLRRDPEEVNKRRKRRSCKVRRESIPTKARRLLDKMMAKKNPSVAFWLKSKSCHDLSVL